MIRSADNPTPRFNILGVTATMAHPAWCAADDCNARLAEFALDRLEAELVVHSTPLRSLNLTLETADGDIDLIAEISVVRQIIPVDGFDFLPRLVVAMYGTGEDGPALTINTFTADELAPEASPLEAFTHDNTDEYLSGLLAYLYCEKDGWL